MGDGAPSWLVTARLHLLGGKQCFKFRHNWLAREQIEVPLSYQY